MMPEQILTPGVLTFVFVAMMFSALIPSLVLKLVMRGLFAVEVSYLLIVLMTALASMASFMALVWLGLWEAATADKIPLVPGLLLVVASILIEAMLLSLFVFDQETEEAIAIWRWVVGIVMQYVVYVAIGMALTLIIVFAATGSGV